MEVLGDRKTFSARAMFGEYAVYAHGKVVGLVCNDQLYVKILPASHELEHVCEKDTPYPGARAYYLVEESQLSQIENLPVILRAISKSVVPCGRWRRKAVRGHVMGSIRGKRVMLQATSHVEGDVFHQALAIEQGAFFEGKSRRSEDPTAGVPRPEVPDFSARTSDANGSPIALPPA